MKSTGMTLEELVSEARERAAHFRWLRERPALYQAFVNRVEKR